MLSFEEIGLLNPIFFSGRVPGTRWKNFCGCLGTRGTLTAVAPAIQIGVGSAAKWYKKYQIPVHIGSTLFISQSLLLMMILLSLQRVADK